MHHHHGLNYRPESSFHLRAHKSIHRANRSLSIQVILMKGDTFRRHVRDGKKPGGLWGYAYIAHTRVSCTHLGLFPRFSLLRGEERGRGPGGNGEMMRCTLPRTRLGLASSPALSNTARPLTGSSQVMSHPVAPRRGHTLPLCLPPCRSFPCAVIFDVRVPPRGLHARA